MDLSYQVKNDSKWKDISIEFDPPLSGYEEVKPRLLQMKADAEEGLGMVGFSLCASKSITLTPNIGKVSQTHNLFFEMVNVSNPPLSHNTGHCHSRTIRIPSHYQRAGPSFTLFGTPSYQRG